jgi:hypothetical protein
VITSYTKGRREYNGSGRVFWVVQLYLKAQRKTTTFYFRTKNSLQRWMASAREGEEGELGY